MTIEITTLKELRRYLTVVKRCYVWTAYSSNDKLFFETSKAAVLRTFAGAPGNIEVNAVIYPHDNDAIYIG